MTTFVAIIGACPAEVLDEQGLGDAYRELWPALGQEQVTLYVQDGAELTGPLHQVDQFISSDDQTLYYQTEIFTPDGQKVGLVQWDRAHR